MQVSGPDEGKAGSKATDRKPDPPSSACSAATAPIIAGKPAWPLSGFAFRPEQRLHKPAEFDVVFRQGRRDRLRHLGLMAVAVTPGSPGQPSDEASMAGFGAPEPSAAGARLGLVVPKKLARRAVQRNLVKRVVREAFRHHASRLPAVDIVIRLLQWPRDHPEVRECLRSEADRLLGRLARRG